MEIKEIVEAKKVRGYCDFCTHTDRVCSHCIPMKETGFKEMKLNVGKSFICDEIEFFLIFCVLSGKVVLTAPNGKQIDIPANSMMLLSKCDILRLTAQESSHIVTFEFAQMPDFCERIRLEYFQQYCSYDYDYTPTHMQANIQIFVEECLFYMRHNMLCNKLSAMKQAEFFYLISLLYTPTQLAAFLHPILGKAMDFKALVIQHYSPLLTATELAERTHYGRKAFYAKFSKEFGMPVKEWIVKQRIKQMRVIAMESRMTSKEMMYQCGFSSQGNFAKFCKKHLGMTPTELINSGKS